jgi:putative membrane protein
VTVLAFFAASVVARAGAPRRAVDRGVRPGHDRHRAARGAVGTATGFPFGSYDYAGTLGAKLLGVPLVIPLAWAMFAYPVPAGGPAARLHDARRHGGRRVGAGLVGPVPGPPDGRGRALDLDRRPGLAARLARRADQQLPGLGAGRARHHRLLQLLPRREADDRVPAALFLWTYASSVLAFAVFFGRPVVALVGAVGMGLVAVPYALSLRRG